MWPSSPWSSSDSSGGRSAARRNREWLTAFHGSAAVRTARFVVHHKDGRLAYLGRRPKPSSKEGRLPTGSRTVVPQGTWAGLTSGFGMGPGVSPPREREIYQHFDAGGSRAMMYRSGPSRACTFVVTLAAGNHR